MAVEITKQEKKASPEAEDAIAVAADPTTSVEDTNPLSLDTGFPSAVRIGSGEYQLSYLVDRAVKDGHVTKTVWNKMDKADRKERVQKVIDAVADEEKSSTASGAGDTAEEAADVRVHADRGIGGSYVALGGGERIRVAAASMNGDIHIEDDAQLAQ